MLTGELPEVNPRGRASGCAAYGHEDFTSYVVWACERALERGLLPHTNLGVLSPRGPRAAARGDRLAGPDAGVGQPATLRRPPGLADQAPGGAAGDDRAAGELRIPFTSGILVGIGETEDERIASLEALAAVHAAHGHIQEVILQNFVPHPRYYGAEVGGDRRRGAARSAGRATGDRRAATSMPLPEWATPSDARGHEAPGRASRGG